MMRWRSPATVLWIWLLAAAAGGEPLDRTDHKTCKEKEYYNTKMNRCCSNCPPGQYRKFICKSNQDTVCEPCKLNSYKEEWSNSYECTRCVGKCGDHQREVQSCSPTTRQICECEPGMICKSQSLHYCVLCVHPKECDVGEGLIKEGTAGEDNFCGPCPVGTFSDVKSSSAKCQPHTNCSQLNKRLVKEGTASEDAVCGQVVKPSTTATSTLTTSTLQPISNESNHFKEFTSSTVKVFSHTTTRSVNHLTTSSTAVTTPKGNRQMVDLFLAIGLLLAFLLILIVSSLLFSRKEYFKSLLLSNKTKGSVYIVGPHTVYVGVEQGDCDSPDQEDPIVKPHESCVHFPQQESVKSQNAGESHVFPVEEEGKLFRDPVPAADY